MNRGDVSTESGGDAGAARDGERTGRSVAARATRAVRWAVESGALAGVGGGVTVLRGLLALRRGERGRGLARIAVGALLVAIAFAQRRASKNGSDAGDREDRAGLDRTDVVDTAPDVEDVAEPSTDPDRHATGEAASEVVDSSADVEDVAQGREADAPSDRAESEGVESQDVESEGVESEDAGSEAAGPGADDYERLGEAAYDEYSREVPVPQRALNLRLLSPNSEVFWGVREADDAVLVAGRFDPLNDGDGVRYVGSSELDGERTLSVPDAVTDHWDAAAGGGTAVVSGTDLVFATAERLRADDQLVVVPAEWADDLLGEAA